MKGHGEKLSRKQEEAIAALLTEPTIPSAAKRVGIGETTLWRWLKNPSFNEAYKEVKRQAVAQTISKIQQASNEAIDTLRYVMNDTDSPTNSRVSAAKSILDMTLKTVELEDVVKRIEELEALTDAKR